MPRDEAMKQDPAAVGVVPRDRPRFQEFARRLRGLEERGAGYLHPTIQLLESVVCSQPSDCVPTTRQQETVGQVALELAHHPSPFGEKLGLMIACDMCRAENQPCECDGHACTIGDLVFEIPFPGDDFRCGVTVRDGKSYRWGVGVRKFRPTD
jgi:hypothetical protein